MICEEVKLGSICDRIGDGIHGTPDYDDNGPYYFFNGSNIVEGSLVADGNTKRVSESEYLKHKRNLGPNTLLISINGTIGNMAYYKGEKCILGKSAAYINLKSQVDRDFIYYALKSSRFQEYIKNANGSTIKNVSLDMLREYSFNLPSIDVQHKIGYVLSTLDDKIHILSQINDNLLHQLEVKYHNLMDYSNDEDIIDSDLGPMPHNWHIEQVSNYCEEMKNGATPSRSNDEYWFNGSIPWVVTGEVNDSIILDTKERITELGLKNSSAKLLPIDTIVMAMYGRGTAARLAYLKIEATTNQACCGMICSTPNRSAFLYETLHQMHDYIDTLASGSVQQNLSKEIIGGLKFLCPPDDVIESLELSKIFDMITVNEKKCKKLIELRDYLLPKLMSGEVDIS